MRNLLLLLCNGALILQWDSIIFSCYVSSAVMQVKSSPSFTNGSCAAGYYFTERSQQSPTCHECTNCTLLHKQELTSCNHTHDSTCGPCLPGYFLGAVSDREVLCQKCSKCPPEGAGTATRWKDCQRAGLDSDMWCSPGYVEPETDPATAQTTAAAETRRPVLGTESFFEIPDAPNDSSSTTEPSSWIYLTAAVCCLILAGLMCLCISGTLYSVRRRSPVMIYGHIQTLTEP